MGLGLAIARRLAHAMGGKIWVESEPGTGCRFSFIVPVKPPVIEFEGKSKIAKKPKFLLVNKKPEILRYIGPFLKVTNNHSKTPPPVQKAQRWVKKGCRPTQGRMDLS